jgi:hypothetical protein
MSMLFQVLNANLVAMRMPYGDEYHTRSATRSAGASVLRRAVVRQPHMGSHPRSVVCKMQAVTVTLWGAVSALQKEFGPIRYSSYTE